ALVRRGSPARRRAPGGKRDSLRRRQQHAEAPRRSISRPRLPPREQALSPGRMGREHSPEAEHAEKHLRDDLRSSDGSADGAAGVDYRNTDRGLCRPRAAAPDAIDYGLQENSSRYFPFRKSEKNSLNILLQSSTSTPPETGRR